MSAPWPLLAAGKVRELYAVDDDHVLLVASDRISALDAVLPTPVPDKGRVLTALTVWWLGQLGDLVEHHLVSATDPRIPPAWAGRALLCRRLRMIPVECVARGYLAGSAVADYRRTGATCGVVLPPGLRPGDRLPDPVFTPARKAATGHDENVDVGALAGLVGARLADRLAELTLAVYRRAAALAAERGILLADTKLEFGLAAGGADPVLGDEVLTPDSSRLWPADAWAPGLLPPSLDKQPVRDWLAGRSGWDGHGPPPPLPADVVAATRQRYIAAYERLTGASFADWPGPDGRPPAPDGRPAAPDGPPSAPAPG